MSGGVIPDTDRHLREEESTFSLPRPKAAQRVAQTDGLGLQESDRMETGDLGDARGDAAPSRDALDGASVGSP
eukprot:CAMPEP_0118813538 /NCGR_PEP_ID=MMETSP1162-20130426/3000_1 /TAXON_ID=33656 /ORGANISM="Phaeocystis Sp, Strain CCMP2710" /LENGTH=72 /DNA_ID=CAMNT_0006743347 /DNA_START=163 /DNA_END=378 /DNA_ORIENTATION=+